MCVCVYVQEDLTKETLAKQFKIVKQETNTSHVMQYGNKVHTHTQCWCTSKYTMLTFHSNWGCVCVCVYQTMSSMKVIHFQGNSLGGARPAEPVWLPRVTQRDVTPSPDVYLSVLKRKLMKSNDITVAKGYLMEISAHMKVTMMIHKQLCSF